MTIEELLLGLIGLPILLATVILVGLGFVALTAMIFTAINNLFK